MAHPTPRRGLARAAVAAALTVAGTAAVLPAMLTPAASAAPSARGPWQDPSYQPRPGQWRPYVLAPESRTVPPVAVYKADPREGRIDGSPEAALKNGGGSVRLTGAADRAGSPLLILDFGKEVAGHIKVRVKGASSTRPKLRACFSESIRYLAEAPGDNDGQGAIAPGCDTANIWNGFPGQPYTEDTDSHALTLDGRLPGTVRDKELRGGFRYATLFLDGPGWVDVDGVSVDYTAAPRQKDMTDYQGRFLSSDNLLNKIWYAGAYTVQLNTGAANTAKSWPYVKGEGDHADAPVPHADPSKDVIYDGGKRDRIIWQGDLAVQAPVAYLSTNDLDAVTNSLSSLAAQQLPDGYMPAESQVGQHNADELRTYGEYVTWFVSNMHEHWLYTGDRAYLAKWWTALTKATAWLESVRAQDGDKGLIAFDKAGSCGHYGYSDCGHETYVNALYARNLAQMADLAKARGDAGAAAAYAGRSAAVKKAINDQLWDEQAGAYRLSREIPGAYPQDGNATAVLAGVAGAARGRRAMAYLRANNWEKYGSLTVSQKTPNASLPPFYAPLPSTFETDARLEGRDASGLDLIRTFWGHQLAQDPGSTFWEHMQPDGTPNLKQFSSLAHGWAAGPTVTLSTRVLGVRPTAAGYSSFAVVPFAGDLTWAEGTVPTPHGGIEASWRTDRHGFGLTVRAPRGTTGRLAVPVSARTRKVTFDGRTVWAGGEATARGVSSDGAYVYFDGVSAGRHVLAARE
ncbi:alpha-L-rhamnosidase C-terminal domain-containing protein [Actinomadura xylanilytica]|uniref:alpha-L-rhamnosidase-related protein n=1 Tax=Actinomadura xylanilytica TaxID=887459 RepID=UPI00255B34E9|nr:alpha-L-rhamnosidase C-terminal domain-containing protein [Actinomadura xylanilytica]MDL4774420.1 alpha-L-rhamnosidase C-terminal domain-containing protein [Actinomadura xylanilytica]